MKKLSLLVFLSAFVLTSYNLHAEEASTVVAVETTTSTAPSESEASETAVVSVQTEEAVSAPAVETQTQVSVTETGTVAVTEETINTENLEFVSGEVTALDETAKTLTVKLYGETENDANQKTLTVKVDETTDITDGEKDRDMKSLAAGTEVDVEFDPASSKATYIFVY